MRNYVEKFQFNETCNIVHNVFTQTSWYRN